MSTFGQPPTNKLTYCCDKDPVSFYDHGGVLHHLHLDLNAMDGYITYQTLYNSTTYGNISTLNISDIYGAVLQYTTPPTTHDRFLIYDPILGVNNDVKIMHMITLSDGYLATGIVKDNSQSTAFYKSWIIKFDQYFNILQQITLEIASSHLVGQHLLQLSNGDFLLTGFNTIDFTYPLGTSLREGFCIRFDNRLNKIWENSFNTVTANYDNDMLVSARELSDGRILVVGSGNQYNIPSNIKEPGLTLHLLSPALALLETVCFTSAYATSSEPINSGRDLYVNGNDIFILFNSRRYNNFALYGLVYTSNPLPLHTHFAPMYANGSIYYNSTNSQYIGTSLLPDISGNNNGFPVVAGLYKQYSIGSTLNTVPFMVFFDNALNPVAAKIYDASSTTYANSHSPFFFPYTYVIPALYTPHSAIVNNSNDGYVIQGYHDDPGGLNNILQVSTDATGRVDLPCTDINVLFSTSDKFKAIEPGYPMGIGTVVNMGSLVCIADFTARDYCSMSMAPEKNEDTGEIQQVFFRHKGQHIIVDSDLSADMPAEYFILNVLGQKIDQGILSKERTISKADLAPGMYFLHVHTSQHSFTHKFYHHELR
jgi:hypothetical protein